MLAQRSVKYLRSATSLMQVLVTGSWLCRAATDITRLWAS